MTVFLALIDKRCGDFSGCIAVFDDHFINAVLKKGNVLVYSVDPILVGVISLQLSPWIYQEKKRIVLRLKGVSDALDLGELVMEEGVFLQEVLVLLYDSLLIIGVAALNELIPEVRILFHDLIIHSFVLLLLLIHLYPQLFQTLIGTLLFLSADPRVLALCKRKGLP